MKIRYARPRRLLVAGNTIVKRKFEPRVEGRTATKFTIPRELTDFYQSVNFDHHTYILAEKLCVKL